MLGKFDADAQLDIVEQGVEAGLIAVAGFGEEVEHGVKPGRIDASDEEIAAQRFQLIEEPLPARDRAAPTLERIAHGLQCQQPLDAGYACRHGCSGGSAGAGRTGNDEVAAGRATRAIAACHPRYARIAVDPHQTHLWHH